jgi:predicted outer membrane repeat protein
MKCSIIFLTFALCASSLNAAMINVSVSQPIRQAEMDAAGAVIQSSPKKPLYNGPQNIPNPSRQGGDTFDDAIQIIVIPDTLIGTTSGYNDDYDEVCPYSGSTSPDVVYYFDCSLDRTVRISLCNAGTDYDTKLYVYEDTYTPGNPYACNDDFCDGSISEVFGLDLFADHTYYIVVDGYGGDFGNYELTIDEFYPCDSFPTGWGDCINENEPCGDDNNSGCGGFPPTWELINCGDTVCGTVWAEGGSRDTDWYSLTLTETKLVTFTAEGEFPMTIGFIDTADCNLFTGLDPYALSVYPCSLLTVSRIAGPGVYWLHVSANNYYDYPCGTANNYYMMVTCQEVTRVWYVNDDGTPGVDCDCNTIQACIDSAANGDTVLVADGIYTGAGNRDIDFGGKEVRLLSSSGPAMTVIDCEGAGRAFYFHQGESSAAVVSGFTIMNGNSGSGGAIMLLAFPDLVFPTISNCWFINNSANSGGAICCSYFDPFPAPFTFISDCRFIGNSAWQGGAFRCYGGSCVIENCLFANNSATYGGALSLALSIPILRNCTIVQNTADSGAGIEYCETSAQAIQCIIAFNKMGASVRMCPPPAPGGGLALECCNIYGNESGDWVDDIADQADSNGNFSLDPLFCDTAAGNFHILDNSPCAPANNSCSTLIGALGGGCICCLNIRGNIDWDLGDAVNVADVTYLVDYLFRSGPEPPCPEEGDVDGSGTINIADVTYLVDYLFRSGNPPLPCPL